MGKVDKILVVGAGIAGPAVSYWLQKFGFSPTLIERASELRTGGQPLDIRGVAVPLVKKMNLYEQICNQRTTLERGRYVDKEGRILHEEEGEKHGFRQDDEVEIIRGDLVQILMDSIKTVPCHFDQHIKMIQQDNEAVTVHFRDGRKERYDFVIGADGIHSTLRQLIFSQEEVQLINLGSYLSIFTIPNYLNLNHCELICESNHKQVSITSDKNPKIAQAAFMFRSTHQLHNIRDIAEQQQFLRDTFQDFGWEAHRLLLLMSQTKDFYFDAIMQVKMKAWTKGRVALLGDAGYCASPLSGQGNNLALVGAYIFAGELKKAEGDYRKACVRYNELLHPFVEENQKFGAWVSRSFLTDEVSKEFAEKRADTILKEIKRVSHTITLPKYE